MTYMVNGEEMAHVGHNGKKEVLFFTKKKEGMVEFVEIPYTFDGIIYSIDK